MSEIPNEVAQILAAAGNVGDLPANIGEGMRGVWPPEGDAEFFIVGASMRSGTFKTGNDQTVPAAVLEFNYTWNDENDPTAEGPRQQSFLGEQFYVLDEKTAAALPEPAPGKGPKARYRINLERLKGHISVLLNKPAESITDLNNGITAVLALLDDNPAIPVQGRIEHRKWQSATFKTEFLRRNLAVIT